MAGNDSNSLGAIRKRCGFNVHSGAATSSSRTGTGPGTGRQPRSRSVSGWGDGRRKTGARRGSSSSPPSTGGASHQSRSNQSGTIRSQIADSENAIRTRRASVRIERSEQCNPEVERRARRASGRCDTSQSRSARSAIETPRTDTIDIEESVGAEAESVDRETLEPLAQAPGDS